MLSSEDSKVIYICIEEIKDGVKWYSVIAQKEGKEVGYISGFIKECETIFWLESIRVNRILERQGIGRDLMNKVVEFSKKMHIAEIQLITYFEPAHTFFLAMGFEVTYSRPHFAFFTYSEMRKLLRGS